MPKKPQPESFTSFRIIGEKAQKLLAKAREGMAKKSDANANAFPESEETQMPEVKVEIGTGSVVRATLAVLAVLGGVMLIWLLQDKLVLVVLGIFVAILVDPGVKHLQRLGVPRGLGIILHFLVALAALMFLIVSLIPIIAEQIQSIAVMLNEEVNAFLAAPQIWLPLVSDETNAELSLLLQKALSDLSIQGFTDALRQVGQSMSTVSQGSLAFAVAVAGSVVNFFLNLVVVLVLAFFFQLEKESLLTWFRGFLPWNLRTYVDDKSEAITWKLGQWVRGQLLLCLCIGSLVFVALLILRMPNALTLALLAGFTEFIPVIGPFFAAVPAVLIAVTQHGFFWGLVVAAVYYVIQWCENNLIVPLIMKRAVGLSPTVTMLAMMVGVSFPNVVHPILGVILSIPSATVMAIFLEDFRSHRRRKMAAH